MVLEMNGYLDRDPDELKMHFLLAGIWSTIINLGRSFGGADKSVRPVQPVDVAPWLETPEAARNRKLEERRARVLAIEES